MLEVYSNLHSKFLLFWLDIFLKRDNNYDDTTKNLLMLSQTKTSTYCNDGLSFRGSISVNFRSNDIEIVTSISFSKSCIKNGMERIPVVRYVNRVFHVIRRAFH